MSGFQKVRKGASRVRLTGRNAGSDENMYSEAATTRRQHAALLFLSFSVSLAQPPTTPYWFSGGLPNPAGFVEYNPVESLDSIAFPSQTFRWIYFFFFLIEIFFSILRMSIFYSATDKLIDLSFANAMKFSYLKKWKG